MYSMSLQTAGALFVMIVFGWFLDLALFRNLVVLAVAFYHYRRAKKLGFSYMKIEREKEYTKAIRSKIKEIFLTAKVPEKRK